MSEPVTLSKGVFIFSLDTEVAWGTHGNRKYAFEYDHVRDVIRRLLALCERYDIRITWAVVGQLMVPGEDAWYHAPDIVEAIRSCAVPQEIGSHSFEHRLDEPSCTAEQMDADLKAAKKVAQEQGIALQSFVFPRNRVKYLDVLEKSGFRYYRGVNRSWYEPLPRPLRRLAHVIDDYLVPSAPTVLPEKVGGLWNIPGSYFYVHRRSWAKMLPISFRVRKVRSGLHRAADQRRIFHLWCHPFNLASDADGLLSGIEQIFQEVSALRKAGRLDQMTMGEFGGTLS